MTSSPVVLIVITNSDRAGAQKHVEHIVSASQSRNINFKLVTGTQGYLTQCLEQRGIECFIVDDLVRDVSLFRDFKALISIIRLIRNVKPDFVHLHSAKAGLLGRIAAKVLGVPVVYTVHGWAFSQGHSRRTVLVARAVERLFARCVDYFILVSNYDLGLGVESKVIGKRTRHIMIHNGIPLIKDYSLPEKAAPDIYRLVTVARLSKQKNLACMIHAVNRLEGPWHLDIVGYGEDASQLHGLVESLGLTNRVSFVGELESVADILNGSHIFLLSSIWEGLPLSLLEAARAGLPMVGTNVGGVSEVIKNNRNGFLVECGDDEEMAVKIETLMSDDILRLSQGAAAREMFLSDFTSEGMVASTLRVYQQVISSE